MRLLAPQPSFVQLRDFFRERSRAYLCMELVEGGELFARIAAKDRFSERGEGRTRSGSVRGVSALTPFSPPAAEARAIAKQLAEAVAYAHGKGVVHRDLKVGEGGARRRVRTEPDYRQLALWVEAAMLLSPMGTPSSPPPHTAREHPPQVGGPRRDGHQDRRPRLRQGRHGPRSAHDHAVRVRRTRTRAGKDEGEDEGGKEEGGGRGTRGGRGRGRRQQHGFQLLGTPLSCSPPLPSSQLPRLHGA